MSDYASVHDVAAYVLSKFDQPISTMKLQKLVYLAQGWHLGLRDKPLFTEQLQAWANGPVCPDLFAKHRGDYAVKEWQWGNARRLLASERIVVDAVIKNYGGLSGLELSELSHLRGTPWQATRDSWNLINGQASTVEIDPEDIKQHFKQVFDPGGTINATARGI